MALNTLADFALRYSSTHGGGGVGRPRPLGTQQPLRSINHISINHSRVSLDRAASHPAAMSGKGNTVAIPLWTGGMGDVRLDGQLSRQVTGVAPVAADSWAPPDDWHKHEIYYAAVQVSAPTLPHPCVSTTNQYYCYLTQPRCTPYFEPVVLTSMYYMLSSRPSSSATPPHKLSSFNPFQALEPLVV